MIVISDSLVLTDLATQFSVDNPIIGYQTCILNSSLITALSADASGFYPASNMANPATNFKWKAADDSPNAIIIDNSVANMDLEFIGLARHNFGSIRAELRLLGSSDGITYDVVLQDAFMLDSDNPFMIRFTKANYSKIKLTISPNSGIPLCAVVMCGPLLTLQRRVYVGHTPITYGRQTINVNGMSESGQFLGRLNVANGRATSVSLKNLTPDWYRTYFDPFAVAAAETPFFFAWYPSKYPREVGYCWLSADSKVSNSIANGMMAVDFSIAGIGS